jgi:hypothetical protein
MQWLNPETGKWEGVYSLILKRFGITRIQKAVRKRKLGTYKTRKIKIQQLALGGEKSYKITFDILILDKHNPKSIGPLNIEIPAKAMFFGKKKLVQHLKNSVDIHVHDFEIVVEADED